MALLKNRMAVIALAMLGLSVSALDADSAMGRFTLPFDAQWGKVELKAGEYTLSGTSTPSWPQIISLTGNGKTVYILAGSERLAPVSDESYLTIVNVAGLHVVREFRSGFRGKSFLFQGPKAVRAQMASAGTGATETAVMLRH